MFAKTVDGLDEVFVEVEDLEKMRTFCREVPGFEEDFSDPGWGAGFKTGARRDLVLTLAANAATGVSLVFACADIDTQPAGRKPRLSLVVTHPLEEGHWGAKIAGFEDPEGNTIYLEQPSTNGQWGH